MTRLTLVAAILLTTAWAGPPAKHVRTRDAVQVDRAVMQVSLDRLQRNLEVLKRMLTLVADRKEQRVLKAQIEEMTADLDGLRVALDEAPSVHRRPPVKLPMRPVPPPPPEMVDPKPMADGRFAAFMQSLQDAAFSADKISLVRAVAPKHHFSTGQVRRVMEAMSFGKDQRAVLVEMYPRMVDPDSAHTLLSVMAHASDRRKAQAELAAIDAAAE